MALWQLDDISAKQFDDGLKFRPDEDGFTRDIAAKYYKTEKFTYIGTPNWHEVRKIAEDEKIAADIAADEKAAEEVRAETEAAGKLSRDKREAAARDRILQITDPEGYAEAQHKVALQAEYDALAPHASKAELAKLKEALGL